MTLATSERVSAYTCMTCVFVGALVGVLIPGTKSSPPVHHGILGAIIAFELNYINVITTIGTVVLVYWLVTRKVRGRMAQVMYGALGFVSVRLILASISFYSK
jgi:hypothetical protein